MDKKELIYKAAVKAFSEHGFDNTKIQMIAQEAGIAVGTVYLYFKSKEEILEYIICCEQQKRIDFLDKLMAEDKPAFDKIRDFLLFHLDNMIRNYDAGKILVQELSFTDVFSKEKVKNIIHEKHIRICELIKEAQIQGSVRASNPRILMMTLLSTVKGFKNSIIHIPDYEKESQLLKTQAIDFMMNGIKAA